MGTKAKPAPIAELPTGKNLPGGGQEGNRRLIKAIVIGPIMKQDLTTGETKTLPTDDILHQLTADGKVLAPPFDKLVLAMLPEQSTSLGQVVEAMVQNIDGFGFRLECRVNIEDPECPEELKTEVLAEKAKLTNFFNNCCVDHSFTELRKRSRHDTETVGEGYWEVIRVPATNDIVGLNHLPSHQVRLGLQDPKFTTFKRKIAKVMPDGTIVLETVKQRKRFRIFVQARITALSRNRAQTRGLDVVWFKEFGDPRTIDINTGEVVPANKAIDMKPEDKAGELIHFKIYNPRTAYGLPRYIGNLITLFGDRAADEVNFITLKNNNIPSMLILAANGQLTKGSIERITEFAESQIQSSDNFSRFLILEAEGQFEGEDHGNVKLEVKPLTSEQMRDQLFQEYSKNNRAKIAESYRLPPIFVGRSDDYTRATAEASRRLADEQVFKPERDEFDQIINKTLMPEMGVRFHRFKSNGPNVTDDEDLIKVMAVAERAGGMTPRLARLILSDILGQDDLPRLDPSVKPDVPFSLQMAEAVKNTAPIEAQPAVKALLGISTPGSIIDQLLGVRDGLEAELFRRIEEDKREK